MKEKLNSILDCLIEEHRIEPGMFPGDRLRKVVKPGFLLLVLAVIVVSAVTLIPSAISTGAGAGKRDLPIYCVQTEEKKIALSFDAAWGNEDTAKILAILKKHDVKVTFFMTGGWVENYPDDVKAILAQGHDLGNHSENHKHMTQLSENEKTEELMKVHNKVKELTGYDMFLFRPPYGDYDNGVVKTARDCGYYTVQWDVDTCVTKINVIFRGFVTRRVSWQSTVVSLKWLKNQYELLKQWKARLRLFPEWISRAN